VTAHELIDTAAGEGSAGIVRRDLRIDVAGHLPFEAGTTELAATVVLAPAQVGERPTLLVCWPGGSYGRAYWDLRPTAASGYSAAEHWARQGYVVVVADHLGVADSDKPADGDALGVEVLAAAAHGFVEELRRRCAAGELHEELPAVDDIRTVGVGHSLGGSVVVAQQARHRSYDAVADIGYTHSAKAAVDDAMGRSDEDARAVALAQADQFFGGTGDSYGRPGKSDSRAWLYGPNDEAGVVEEDIDVHVVWPRGPYIEALTPGLTVPIAAELTGPLFLAFAEIDVPEAPRLEAQFYPACTDITLFLVPDAAHCSNFSPSRQLLWDRIAAWERSLA
jgi:hypothetical protein